MTLALRFAPSSTLAPMQYLEIPFATLIGWAIFGDLPERPRRPRHRRHRRRRPLRHPPRAAREPRRPARGLTTARRLAHAGRGGEGRVAGHPSAPGTGEGARLGDDPSQLRPHRRADRADRLRVDRPRHADADRAALHLRPAQGLRHRPERRGSHLPRAARGALHPPCGHAGELPRAPRRSFSRTARGSASTCRSTRARSSSSGSRASSASSTSTPWSSLGRGIISTSRSIPPTAQTMPCARRCGRRSGRSPAGPRRSAAAGPTRGWCRGCSRRRCCGSPPTSDGRRRRRATEGAGRG